MKYIPKILFPPFFYSMAIIVIIALTASFITNAVKKPKSDYLAYEGTCSLNIMDDDSILRVRCQDTETFIKSNQEMYRKIIRDINPVCKIYKMPDDIVTECK